MPKRITILLLLCLPATTALGQLPEIIARQLPLVKAVPYHYYGRQAQPPAVPFSDSAFLVIKKLGRAAIPFLMEHLTDTTLTGIGNTCTDGQYCTGDIALLLINDISQIPFASVTGMQYCLWDKCSHLPDGFMESVAYDRAGFYAAYRNYYYGNKRKKWARMLHRGKKQKTKRHG